ncbi:MAG TPA: TM2 domain-containing protein [Gammaproteobacteria bacterium]
MKNLFRDLTVSTIDVHRETERLREQVRALDDEQRRRFYEHASAQLRDPDTYAVLNWMFFGVHHFYLGRWLRGAINLLIVTLAVLFMIAGLALVGVSLVIALSVIELLQLFRSQVIVADYNNIVQAEVLQRLV